MTLARGQFLGGVLRKNSSNVRLERKPGYGSSL
jgi:hypothetical protein